MPLTAANFVVKGPVKSVDMLQFFNLFTGAMTDQPVVFKNTLFVGGNQGNTTVPLRLYGATGQTGHLIDLYTDPSQAQPGFGFSALGSFGWGPGGAAPTDTTLSRIATQNGHATDTAGLLINPYMEISGAGGLGIDGPVAWKTSGATLNQGGAGSLLLIVNQDLQARNLNLTGTVTSQRSVPNAALGTDTARLNLLTNGGFEIWQRGNGPFTVTQTYCADRWLIALGGTDTLSVSKDTANKDTTSNACAACVFTHGNGTQTLLTVLLKTSDGHQFQGKTLSMSARVRCNAANSVRLILGGDGTGATGGGSAFHSGSGAYETLTCTAVIPADATFVQAAFQFVNNSSTAYLDNAMLVVGSVAADYAPLHPADDLARCLRYYEQMDFVSNQYITVAQAYSATQFAGAFPYSIKKAVAPTVTIVGTPSITGSSFGPIATTSMGPSSSGYWTIIQYAGTVASGLTAGNATVLLAGTSTSFRIEANP